MRPLAPADLSAIARALLDLPRAERAREAAGIVAEAEAADRYRKRLGRAHPRWGTGTLESAARARPLAPERPLGDPEYLCCLRHALDALIARRGRGLCT